MEIRKSTFDYSPSLIEYEGNFIRINFDVEKIELANGTDSKEGGKNTTRMAYSAYVVRIEQPIERGKVVDAIVVSAYPTDKMQAIINNHFANLAKIADGKKLDADDEEHEAEYEAMQEWRTKAKAVATDVIDNYISTH
ncbi:hypothetical protein [Segatella copri]|uniref:Uncharacterized protein n=1 Tax=Segatella copri TaxID=165179 RepID=A0AAW5UM68_9BACT|nr:hypothetical protein [Segatella copri]MCW4110046.1 hypothetical protein [Segatella copri]MCW4120252.1 hypothetical protein [Segatella copri]MCW4154024.1 hypothetical protein [Segatella copri]